MTFAKTFAAVFFAILALSILPPVPAQSPLDQPGKKQVTVGSEIKRACLELAAVADASTALDFDAFEQEMRGVIQKNRNANTDSDGFMLGARFTELLRMHVRLNVAGIEKFNDPAKMAAARTFTSFCATEIRRLQNQLGLSTEEFLAAAPFSSEETRANARVVLTQYVQQ